MIEPDWRSVSLAHRLRVDMVDPIDHSLRRGQLEVSGGRASTDIEADTRASLALEAVDWTQWVPGSWVRVTHSVGDWSETLFTGFLASDGHRWASGGETASPRFYGALKAIEGDRLTRPLVAGIGARSSELIGRVLDGATPPREWRLLPGFSDSRYQNVTVFDAGRGRLDVLSDLCDACGARYGVTADGVVTVGADVAPSLMEPTFELDAGASDTTVLAGSVTRSDGALTAASRSIVTHRASSSAASSSRAVSGWADVPSSSQLSSGRRGFTVAEVHEVSDMTDPVSDAHAAMLARDWLPRDSEAPVEWQLDSAYLPVSAGDVGWWAPDGGRRRLVQVVCRDVDLATWVESLTLREV